MAESPAAQGTRSDAHRRCDPIRWTVICPRLRNQRDGFDSIPGTPRLLHRLRGPGDQHALSADMPEVSRFYGVVIRMYFNDHQPAHFHALHGEDEAIVSIGSLAVLRGGLRRRALALVLEWASEHRAELQAAWECARSGEDPGTIEPLE